MAELPPPRLLFEGGCPDCGLREIELPPNLDPVGDDFDWRVRDYDGFRAFMLEDLAARSPQRTRWTSADHEVVLIEAVAAILDRLSDMLDRVAAEAYLETARRPDSVRRHLRLIGYDAVEQATAAGLLDEVETVERRRDELDLLWLRHPEFMERAKAAGPSEIRTQRRMVTVVDYAERLEDHPLVRRATAWSSWTGSWTTVSVAVITSSGARLDRVVAFEPDMRARVERFHAERAVLKPSWEPETTIRTILNLFVEAYRMAGQEVVLQDAVPVPIMMAISVGVDPEYFQSEVRREIERALGTGPGGFFEPGRLRFGEDLHASDIIETIMSLEGVENVCLNRFKRLGRQFPDETDSGLIVLEGLEVAVLDNDPRDAGRGYFRLDLHGGRRG